jgi:hypothetical protein
MAEPGRSLLSVRAKKLLIRAIRSVRSPGAAAGGCRKNAVLRVRERRVIPGHVAGRGRNGMARPPRIAPTLQPLHSVR